MKYLFILLLLSQTLYASEFSAQDFEHVRENFLAIYTPIVKAQTGLDLQIELDTEVPYYFGGMSVKDNIMAIMIGSEFDRENGVTPDLYAFILCHEVGHLLGGEPKKKIKSDGSKFSSEGQSDYYGSLVCLKSVFKKDLMASKSAIAISAQAAKNCEVSNALGADQIVCKRIINAGRELFHYIHLMYLTYSIDMPEPNMDVPEAAGLSAKSEYPSFQCRMDTIAAGALEKPRPGCWYLP